MVQIHAREFNFIKVTAGLRVRGRQGHGPVAHGVGHTVAAPPLSALALMQARASERSLRTHALAARSNYHACRFFKKILDRVHRAVRQ